MTDVTLDVEHIQRIIQAFANSDMTDLDVAVGATRVRIARGHMLPSVPAPAVPVAAAPAADVVPVRGTRAPVSADPELSTDGVDSTPVGDAPSAGAGVASTDRQPGVDRSGLVEIPSPMVGVFYRRPNPEEPPYVQLGDQVGPSTPICTIEVMKMFTEVKAGVAGRVVQILLEDEQLVREGDIIMLVDPA